MAKTPKDEALRRLAQYVKDQKAVQTEWAEGNSAWVALARADGASWTEVGRALQTSKQAAHERYGA
jgi:hypothetical protein